MAGSNPQPCTQELEYNLWEHILVRLVDYGHTFSPAMEMAAMTGDTAGLLHGEAVNCDMALTTQVPFCRRKECRVLDYVVVAVALPRLNE